MFEPIGYIRGTVDFGGLALKMRHDSQLYNSLCGGSAIIIATASRHRKTLKFMWCTLKARERCIRCGSPICRERESYKICRAVL
jgi:hypothetical protein